MHALTPVTRPPSNVSQPISAGYLWLLFRRSNLYGNTSLLTVEAYLKRCHQEGLQPGPLTLTTLSPPGPDPPRYPQGKAMRAFAVFYERLGRPRLVAAAELAGRLRLGGLLAHEVINWLLRWQCGWWSHETMAVYQRTWLNYAQYLTGQGVDDAWPTEEKIRDYLAFSQQGGVVAIVLDQRELILKQVSYWLAKRDHRLDRYRFPLPEPMGQPAPPGLADSPLPDRLFRYRQQWQLSSQYGIGWAAPLIRRWLSRGYSLEQISTLQLGHIVGQDRQQLCLRWSADSPGGEWLSSKESELLTYYLRSICFSYQKSDWPYYAWEETRLLFAELAWPKLWPLCRWYLRQQKSYYPVMPVYRHVFADQPPPPMWSARGLLSPDEQILPWSLPDYLRQDNYETTSQDIRKKAIGQNQPGWRV